MSASPALARNGKPIVTHCSRGHEYTPETTIYRKNGSRNCLLCKRMARQASAPPREPVDLPQDRAPYIDEDGAIMLYAAYIRQAIADYVFLPEHKHHWRTAAALLVNERMLLADGQVDTRGYSMPARYARKEPA